jgi:hypothetical protein
LHGVYCSLQPFLASRCSNPSISTTQQSNPALLMPVVMC